MTQKKIACFAHGILRLTVSAKKQISVSIEFFKWLHVAKKYMYMYLSVHRA